MSYENSTLIGVCDVNGQIHLNPSPNRVIGPGERLVIIAEDDASIQTWTGAPQIAQSQFARPSVRPLQQSGP